MAYNSKHGKFKELSSYFGTSEHEAFQYLKKQRSESDKEEKM
jgi:hypothetical protein